MPLQVALDDAVVRVRSALESSHDLQGAAHSADNAFRLYLRTRPGAAAESVKRAKALPKVGVPRGRGWGWWVCGTGWWWCDVIKRRLFAGGRRGPHCIAPEAAMPPALWSGPPSSRPTPPTTTRLQEGIHPLLAAALPSAALGGLEAQSSLGAIAAALKAYRPAQTVFEAEVAAARKGAGAGALPLCCCRCCFRCCERVFAVCRPPPTCYHLPP